MGTNETTREIMGLFNRYGHLSYGEGCTQLEHAVQAGWFAAERGYDDELVAAAFLHDIGHIYPLQLEGASVVEMGGYGLEAHDRWGEEFLRSRGFSDRIVATVRNHVASKRYLCHAEAGYAASLSAASRETLAHQGGPMTSKEAAAFEQDPYFENSLRLRRLDEAAKLTDFPVTAEHMAYFARLLDRMSA
jgi:predicted HD phosphohydrolase